MNDLKKFAGLLNDEAPENHFLAYITPSERDMLVDAGGVKTPTPSGIFAYPPQDNYTSSYDSSQNTSGRTSSTSGAGGGSGYSGGGNNNNNNNNNNNREQYSAVTQYTTTPQAMGTVDADDEYLAPDIDHYKATQKAIKSTISDLDDRGLNLSDYDDLTKEQQEIYQTEMNKLKGTEGVNYSYYAGNDGTINLSFNVNLNDTYATNPGLTPVLRFLVAAGRTIKQNATTDYGTGRYGGAGTDGSSMYAVDGGGWLGRVFNADGSINENVSESEAESIYNEVQNQLPFIIGGTQPQDSMVNQYFANTSNNLGISNNFMASYDKAKADLAKTLNMTSNASQFGYNANMSASNIYYNYLKEQGLL